MSDQSPFPPEPPVPPSAPPAGAPIPPPVPPSEPGAVPTPGYPVPPAPSYAPPAPPSYPPPVQPGYQPPPPQYGVPGQVPPQAPGAGMPPQMAPAPKKRRVWLWVVLVIVLLLCCGGVALALLGGLLVSSATSDAATVALADTHYTAAKAALDGIQAESPSGDAASPTAYRVKADAAFKLASTELDASRASAAKISSTEARAAYEQGLDEAAKRLEALKGLADAKSGITQFSAVAKEAAGLYSEGSRKINEAVGLMNKSLYSRAGVEAGRAKAFFTQSRAKFAAADAMEATADLEKVIVYIDLQLDKVDYVIQMANYGVRGNLSAYNKAVPKFNAINKKIAASPEPSALTDPNWGTGRLTDLAAAADDANAKAASLLDKAHKLLTNSGN